ncbi:MAG: response regulator transcription factor [Butyrivibrio hungatei]|nr:response regulator transcription factor [Butyrivibrio hungatei]
MEKEKYKVLVVDDEPQIAGLLKVCLEMQGMEVSEAYDGNSAYEMFSEGSFDLIITDVMMPVMDGYELVEKIRQKSHVPVLFLTAKGDVLDRIKGLNIGADDYIVKPFDPMEVAARVLSTLRRCYGYDKQGKKRELVCGSLRLNLDHNRLYKNGKAIELTALEYRVGGTCVCSPSLTLSQCLHCVRLSIVLVICMESMIPRHKNNRPLPRKHRAVIS